ncbi:cytochrome c/c1 heme-lyase [Staphylotrichum tortipilum]|uniref:Holocytochrome c-type synthase n=1 Tax=Staphylotrichum tortipilum TaxID=2831512 RepID=A0AAN6MNB0_9PEZI|nr:cytochrome c/c1 heme-lyase [Staphylotrichum longicolle]
MHTDLLDTVLVGRNGATAQGNNNTVGSAAVGTATGTASMKGLGSAAADGDAAKCPVDDKTRELWLQQAQQARAAQAAAIAPATPHPQQAARAATVPPPQQSSPSWSSWLRFPSFSRQTQADTPTTAPSPPARAGSQLDESRIISSIPRSSDPGPSACPANDEQETGASKTGRWVYPSEKQFFDAMKRKGHDAAAADMKTVVPIHNAVNERAWAEILKWEAPYVEPVVKGGCGGPRLHSFAGLGSATMSPKARINTLLGYTAPFDRHDWVVDRCGTRVEYIIDFYSGRNDTADGKGKLNFYLDVRPKLNSWEGVKMRAMRAAGVV